MGPLTSNRMTLAPVHIGVDIGQKQDPTAIVVAELSERLSGRMRHVAAYTDVSGYHQPENLPILETVYTVHMMQRLPLGTSYPEVAARVAEVACSDRLLGRERLLLIDETGVGRPVYEMIAEAVKARAGWRGQMRPVTFTAGDVYERDRHGTEGSRLGKAHLVSRLQALLQARPERIELPAEHPEAPAVREEIKNYEIRVDSATAHDTYGAFKTVTHDDLVTALGLAVLDEPSAYRVSRGARMF